MTISERVLGAIAGGEYQRMKECYWAFVKAGLIDEQALGGAVADDDSLNSATVMRFRIIWLQAANPNPAFELVK